VALLTLYGALGISYACFKALKAKRGKALAVFFETRRKKGKRVFAIPGNAHGDAGRLFWHSALFIQ
jgi:hypothetical protein